MVVVVVSCSSGSSSSSSSGGWIGVVIVMVDEADKVVEVTAVLVVIYRSRSCSRCSIKFNSSNSSSQCRS